MPETAGSNFPPDYRPSLLRLATTNGAIPATTAIPPYTAQRICPVMKLPGRMLIPWRNQMAPINNEQGAEDVSVWLSWYALDQASFGLFLLPGGLPRRFSAVIQAGGRPRAPAAPHSESFEDEDSFRELLSFRPQLGEHFINVYSCRTPSVETQIRHGRARIYRCFAFSISWRAWGSISKQSLDAIDK